MFPQLQFLFGALLALPITPYLAWLGHRTKKAVPRLPAAAGPTGITPGAGTPFQLYILGESTMAGVGVDTHQNGFAGAAAQGLQMAINRPIRWQVFARPGITAKGVTQEIVPNLPTTAPDLLLIGLGGNDTFELNTPARWARHNKALIRQLRQKYPSAPIVYIQLPPVGQFPAFPPLLQLFMGGVVRLHGQALEGLTKNTDNVWFCHEAIDLEAWLTYDGNTYLPADFFSDGVHPSKLTYQLWAKEVVQYIQKQQIV
jgi:lysophospholipase L1-like esterase